MASTSASIFLNEENDPNVIPIVLVDSSGSMQSVMPSGSSVSGQTVFDVAGSIIKELPFDNFRLIFWCSSQQETGSIFSTGTFTVPYVVKKQNLSQPFKHVNSFIRGSCLTYPHLGFVSIPSEWISDISVTKIYYITDGMISVAHHMNTHTLLSDAIKKLFTNNNKVELNIITVEPSNKEFGKLESTNNLIGCDVFKLIQNNHLTKYITSFTSYTPNNMTGYVHLKKVTAPPGFITFGDKYFSENNIQEFIKYIMELISNNKSDEDLLLGIVQKLTTTICGLVVDKPLVIKNNIMNTFSNLFADTVLDMMFVNFIITDAVSKELNGQASIYAEYRANLKKLYQQANQMLETNVKQSIGLNDQFCTLVIDDSNGQSKIITGHQSLVDKTMMLHGKVYPNAAVTINSVTMPVIPCNLVGLSEMNEQCLRQWTRSLVAQKYPVNPLDDSIIYIVLGMVLQVVMSTECNEEVKNTFRQLGNIMLKKKRQNTDITELSKLEAGSMPIPNSGRIEDFNRYMATVMKQLNANLSYKPMTMWYLLCLALGNEKMIKNQLIHCITDIKEDTGSETITLAHMDEQVKNIEQKDVPKEDSYDYKCIITLDNIELTGGFTFLPHTSVSGLICRPMCTLSEDGYNTLITSDRKICPLCYGTLTDADFSRIGPKPNVDHKNIISSDTVRPNNVWTQGYNNNYASMRASTSSYSSVGPSTSYSSQPKKQTNKLTRTAKCVLVVMKGTVGSGKTTFTEQLQKACDSQDVTCIIEGVDKYTTKGFSFKDAQQEIMKNILAINDFDVSKPVVVCIDTCGERTNNTNMIIFDVDFRGWTRVNVEVNLNRSRIPEYLAWSLRNVLRRGPSSAKSNYNLNPIGASLRTCIDVHTDKAKKLQLTNRHIAHPLTHRFGMTVEQAIEQLNEKANSYEDWLVAEGNALIADKITKIIELSQTAK